MNARRVAALCSLPLLLVACAGRVPASLPAGEGAARVSAATLFAEQAAALAPGQARAFADTPFGPATVEAGAPYVSGLGNACRPGRARTERGGESAFALCRSTEGGAWRVLPPVFEAVPR